MAGRGEKPRGVEKRIIAILENQLRRLEPKTCSIAAGVPLSPAFTSNLPRFLERVWIGSEPPWAYLFFLVATLPGSFADGVVNPGDIAPPAGNRPTTACR